MAITCYLSNRMTARILCGFAVTALALAAQPPSYENRTIAAIEFVPAQILDARDLARALPFKQGDSFHAEDVATAIDNLFATGRFEDIVVEADSVAGGVAVRFVTRPTYFFGGITVEGKIPNPPNRPQIANAAQLQLGAPFRDEDLANAKKAIDDLLQSNGLYGVQVTPQITRDDGTQQIFVTVNVPAGKRARYTTPVIAGDGKLPTGTILKATGWRIPIIHWYRQVTARRTRGGAQGVLAAYQKKDRLKATVDLQKLDYDPVTHRVRPTLSIDPGPRVEIKAVEANVSKSVLKRYVPVYEEHTVDNDLLSEGKRNLIDYFQGRGYYDVNIVYRVLPQKDDLETIEYVISEGQRYKVVKLTVTANHYFTEEEIRDRMYIAPASFTQRRGRYSEAFQRKDRENLTNLYRSNGFQDVQVNFTVDREYQGKTGQMAITVAIDEGAQWMVDRLDLNGVSQVDMEAVSSELASAAGQPFANLNMATDRTTVLTYYYERGFPDATFKTTSEPSGQPHHVNVTYTINEGDRKFVRGVITSGITRTRRSLINKSITMKAGDPLSPIAQTDIQKDLYDLGIFARVDTAIQNRDSDTEEKYVVYNFEEANRYTLGLGFGAQVGRFGTPSSAKLSAPGGATGFSPLVSMDVSRLNFLGIGHTVGLHGLYSSLEKRGSFTYHVPRFLGDRGRSAAFTALYDNSLNVLTFASKREEASFNISQKFSKDLAGQFGFSYRRVSVTNVVIPVLLVPQLAQPVRIGILTANLSQDRRDNPADPHRGIYNTVAFGMAGNFFGSQRSFGRVLARNATYYQITKSLVFARQTQFGVIVPFSPPAGISRQESVPLPERFFGGGGDTLRAFPFSQAGPRDTGVALVAGHNASAPTGFPLGGNALFYNNLELRFPLIGANIGGVLFHDMGNIFTSVGNMSLRFHQHNLQDFDYTTHAVGFGVRYKTPVGPVRVDLAYSINPPSYIGFSGTAADLLTCRPGQTATAGPCVPVRQNVSHFQFFFSIGQTF